jgi:hypothetical protein
MPNDASTLNPLEKVSAVEDHMKSGDSFNAQNVLNSVGAQQIFMDRLANIAAHDQLPGLQINFDQDHHAQEIKTSKMIVSSKNGELSAHANGLGNKAVAGWNHLVESVSAVPEQIRETFGKSALGDCLATSGTSNSCENRRVDAQLKKVGAD